MLGMEDGFLVVILLGQVRSVGIVVLQWLV